MNAVDVIANEVVLAGYQSGSVVRDYSFADVMVPGHERRSAALAAFTQTPPSYRSAALAVVESDHRSPEEVVSEYRALGAPLLFLVDGDEVSIWQVNAELPARCLRRSTVDRLPELFLANRSQWRPESIHRAKSIGLVDTQYQLDFVDVGLLPAIEGEIHGKLDRLLRDAIAKADGSIDKRLLFRATFRFIAAKVLQDREHPVGSTWDRRDVASVLQGIGRYYSLPGVDFSNRSVLTQLAPVWNVISSGISFRNVSADDLAFVYEETLVTPETRQHFGTHSTPRPVAEYVISRLGLWRRELDRVRIYEPFAGAGVFLVAALRHLRESLPSDWSDAERHSFAVQRIFGDEVDSFAREVATLSLILADYPNANGWRIEEQDLIANGVLAARAKNATIVVCNPPFEAFSTMEKKRYSEAASRDSLKAGFALDAVLDVKPDAIGFVLPRPFVLGSSWQPLRNRIESIYREIEFVALPDRVFRHSNVRSALLIASERRDESHRGTVVTATTVADRDREAFLRKGSPTSSRTRTVPFLGSRQSPLWVPELIEVWDALDENPTLGDVAEIHRGIEWLYPQADARSTGRKAGYRRGFLSANALRQYAGIREEWLDFRSESLKAGGAWPWKAPKVIANAARLSRGPWCVAAVADTSGLVCSQQLVGVWPRHDHSISVQAIAAVLNGPLANAFLAVNSDADRIRNVVFERVPLPSQFPVDLERLVTRYQTLVLELSDSSNPSKACEAAELLDEIDSMVLGAYDLPPRLEGSLLNHFVGSERPTVHPWKHWAPPGLTAFFSLRELRSEEFARARSQWVQEIFQPLSEQDAALLREYVE